MLGIVDSHKQNNENGSLTHYTKMNSIWYKHFNMTPEIIKLLEKTLCSEFLDKVIWHQRQEEKYLVP